MNIGAEDWMMTDAAAGGRIRFYKRKQNLDRRPLV